MTDIASIGNGSNPAVYSLALEKQLDPAFLLALGVRDSRRPGSIEIDYLSEDGEFLFHRYRNPKTAEHRFGATDGIKLRPYGLWRLPEARVTGRLILTEGESDTWALWQIGIPALGIPASTAIPPSNFCRTIVNSATVL